METVWICLERKTEHGVNWQVRQINGIEIPDWQKGQSYSTLETYIEEQAKREG